MVMMHGDDHDEELTLFIVVIPNTDLMIMLWSYTGIFLWGGGAGGLDFEMGGLKLKSIDRISGMLCASAWGTGAT